MKPHASRLPNALRALRTGKRLSLKVVAGRAGLSIGLLSQIERGLTTPSMRSLRQISAALGVSPSLLFEAFEPDDTSEGRHVVRRSGRKVLGLEHIGLHMEIMSPEGGGPIQGFASYLRPGGESGPEFDSHEGHEFGIVVDGCLDLFLGTDVYNLAPGDSFAFCSETPHRYANPGPTMTYVHWVITPPIY